MRWAWLTNMVLFHGIAAAYIWKNCSGPVPFYGMKTVHEAMCFGTVQYPEDKSPLFWGSMERWIWATGALLGVTVNVIPKYMSGDEATRHMYHMKTGTMNPLLFHIIGGIMTLLASGFVMLYCDYTGQKPSYQWLKVVYFCDIIHQLGINRMLRNHDGIWFLRCGNQASGIGKMVVMLNMANKPIAQVDQLFFASCGFLGTRVWCTVMFMGNYMGFPTPTLALEYWYSMGVMAAHVTVFFRGWKMYGLLWWLCVVNSSTMYFHQLWRPWVEYRTQFIYLCIVLTTLVGSVPDIIGMAITIGFAYTGFQIPHFKREPMSSDVTKMLNIFQETSSIPEKKSGLLKKAGIKGKGEASAADQIEDEEDSDDEDFSNMQDKFANVVQNRQSVAVSRFFTGNKIL